MKYRERWMDGDATELERVLLRAVANERPSWKLQRRMRIGLDLASSLIPLKAAAAGLSVAALVTGVAMTLVNRNAEETTGASQYGPPLPAVQVIRTAESPKNSVETVDGATRSAIASGRPLQLDQPKTVESQTPSQTSARTPLGTGAVRVAPARASGTDGLGEQMRLLDRARALLGSGESERTLAELARYSRLYPRGAFSQEAMVLRVEALQHSGQNARASSLAREFVARHADSPHVGRVARLAASPDLKR